MNIRTGVTRGKNMLSYQVKVYSKIGFGQQRVNLLTS